MKQAWRKVLACTTSPYRQHTRGGDGSGVPESTPAGFYVFLSDPESKICEKPDPESLFNFGSSRSLCDHILSKNMDKFGLIDDCSRSLNRSRVLKFENFPDPDQDQNF